ncbi:hypothetical protein SAMN05216464_101692 [Mucilaginibacter pineti]|uniref:Uncharacterized protein n=1 Tax=Mucilaginibacter pineti TaxID=1391627 RepID=A0A1G6UM00_9SPHI|nr:hypothetical protein SAMN05216464_101692 [Mucilaginibacter pineti]
MEDIKFIARYKLMKDLSFADVWLIVLYIIGSAGGT